MANFREERKSENGESEQLEFTLLDSGSESRLIQFICYQK